MEESYWNPDYDIYSDVRQAYKDNPVGYPKLSDASANYLAQVALMKQQYDYDASWFNNFESPAAKYNQYKGLGYSDAFIAQVLSGGSQAKSTPIGTVSGGSGSGQFEDTISAINSALGSVQTFNDSVQTDINADLARANINNLNSSTALNNVNAGLRPSEVASQNAANYGNANASNASADRTRTLTPAEFDSISAATDLTVEQCHNYELQNYYYADVTEAQLRQSDALVDVYFSEVRRNNAAAAQSYSEVDLNKALENQANANTANINADTTSKKIANEEAKMDLAYYRNQGLKISWDDEKKVTELVAQGKIDEAEKYAHGIFKYQLTRSNAAYWSEYVSPTEVQASDEKSQGRQSNWHKRIMDYSEGIGNVFNGHIMLNPAPLRFSNPYSRRRK